jgi:hypothetical protein
LRALLIGYAVSAAMSTCPTCGCDLPGTETLCRDCYEKQYAMVSDPKKNSWWRPEDWVGVLLMIAIVAPPLLASDWFFSGRFVPLGQAMQNLQNALGVLWQCAQWLLAAGAVAAAIWYNLKARSVKMVLLWSMYVPLIVGFCLWKLTNNGTWLTVTVAGRLLVEAQRYNARRRGF